MEPFNSQVCFETYLETKFLNWQILCVRFYVERFMES